MKTNLQSWNRLECEQARTVLNTFVIMTRLVAEHPRARRRMQKTRGKDNPWEMRIRRGLYAEGVRYRVHFPVVGIARRSIDLAIPSKKIAIFLDGCFWHGCPQHCKVTAGNKSFWVAKIEGNRARDTDTTTVLQNAGWMVLRFWEHMSPDTIVTTVLERLRRFNN